MTHTLSVLSDSESQAPHAAALSYQRRIVIPPVITVSNYHVGMQAQAIKTQGVSNAYIGEDIFSLLTTPTEGENNLNQQPSSCPDVT